MPIPANLIPQRKPAREPAAGRPNDSGECKAEADLPDSTDPGLEIEPSRHGVQLKRCSPALDRLVVRLARLGFTDIYHERVRKHRSEEHTSELQSRLHLVCRLLLEKKKK